MIHRPWAPFFAALSVAGVLAAGWAFAGGLGADEPASVSGATDSPTSISAEAWSKAPTVPGASVRDEARRVFESFAGTVEEQNALHVVQAHAANADMDACMEKAGHPEWDWSLGRAYAAPRDALNAQFWLAEPLRRWRSEDLVASRAFIEAEAVMNADNPDPDLEAAVSECLSVVGSRSEQTIDEATPERIEQLTLAWYDMVTSAGDELALPSASTYLECMDAADIAALDDPQLPATEIGPAMSLLGPDDSDIPHSTSDETRWNSPGWQRLLAGEDELIAADWSCREEVYVAAISVMSPLIQQFADTHADEIAQARQAWDQVASRARELGYRGEAGPLDH